MNGLVKKVLKTFIFIFPKVEKLFGLSDFAYRNKRLKVLTLLSFAMKVFYIIVYPVSCYEILGGLLTQHSGVTMLARNVTFLFNWLLLVLIFASELFINNQAFGEITQLCCRLIELQSLGDNLILVTRFTLKATILFIGVFQTSYQKYTLKMKTNLTSLENVMLSLVFLPFVILTLTSNRIYVANTIIKHCLIQNAAKVKTPAINSKTRIELSTINYRRLHRIFLEFNKSNQINLLVVLGFCTLNIVYEVRSLCFGLSIIWTSLLDKSSKWILQGSSSWFLFFRWF